MKLLTRLQRARVVRQVLAVAGGTAGAQLIGLLFSPVITRMYGSEAYGIYGIFTSVLAMIVPLAAFNYPSAIVLPRDDSEASRVVILSTTLSLAVSSSLTLVLLVFGDQLFHILSIPEIVPYLWILPVNLFADSLFQISRYWLYRRSDFEVTAKLGVLSAIMTNVFKAGGGMLMPGGGVLIACATAGTIARTIIYGRGISHSDQSLMRTAMQAARARPRILLALAKRYQNFAVYRTPEVFINALIQSVPVFLLAALYSPGIAGYYTLARTTLATPSQLLSKSLGDVLYPRLARAASSGRPIRPEIFRSLLYLFFAGLIPFGAIAVAGSAIYGIVFGTEWEGAGLFAQALTAWLFTAFATRPVTVALLVMNKQRYQLLHTVASGIIRTGSLLLGYVFTNDAYWTIVYFSLSGAATNLVLIGSGLRFAKRFDESQAV